MQSAVVIAQDLLPEVDLVSGTWSNIEHQELMPEGTKRDDQKCLVFTARYNFVAVLHASGIIWYPLTGM